MSDAPVKVLSIPLGNAGLGMNALRRRAWAEIEATRAAVDVLFASIVASGSSERRLIIIYTNKQLAKE